jgi:glycosyltransferase involved in cell wall biosynthesis
MEQLTDAESHLAVSIVMPVLDEARDIGSLLLDVLNQAAPRGGFEVLVVDGGSTDETRSIVRALTATWPALRLLDNPRKLSSSGRNIGAHAAKGTYLLYLDGHCTVPRNDYLVRLVEIFESTGADCLCRPQPVDKTATGNWDRAIAAARHSWLGHNAGSDIYGGAPGFTDPRSAGAAYLRAVIEELGGYDERFDACEDVEFNHRVATRGYRSYRHPDLTVHYHARSTIGGLFRQMKRYGRGRARLMRKHHELVPWPFLAAPMICTVGLAVASLGGIHDGVLVIASASGLWLAIAGVESTRRAVGRADGFRILASFLVIHFGLVLGFWNGISEVLCSRTRWAAQAPDPSICTSRSSLK